MNTTHTTNTISAKNVLASLKIIILALIVAVGIQYIYAFVGPPGAPTTCTPGYPGCDAPINVSSTPQNKFGLLGLQALAVTNSFTYATGTPVVGQVLTVVSPDGTAAWRNVQVAAPIPPSGSIILYNGGTWTVPASITHITVEEWGGGGGGGGRIGRGGNAGNYVASSYTVSPGDTVSVSSWCSTGGMCVGNGGSYVSGCSGGGGGQGANIDVTISSVGHFTAYGGTGGNACNGSATAGSSAINGGAGGAVNAPGSSPGGGGGGGSGTNDGASGGSGYARISW